MKRIDEIFDYQNGLVSSNVNIVDEKLGSDFIPYLRPSKSMGNLLVGYVDKTTVDKKYVSPAFSIVVSTDGAGSHTYSYVYPYEFIGNSNTISLYPKNPNMTLEERLFYSMIITSNRYKFDYARKPKGEKLFSIRVPEYKEVKMNLSDKVFNVEKLPEYLLEDGYDNACNYIENINLDEFDKEYRHPKVENDDLNRSSCMNWQPYLLTRLFTITKSKGKEQELCFVNEISATSMNNGVRRIIESDIYYSGEYLTLSCNGTTGGCDAFYQDRPFTITSDAVVLIPKFNMNAYIAMFIIAVIQKEKFRYAYGRKMSQDKMKRVSIRLPSKMLGGEYEPDWSYMENYIKSLPYSSAL